KDKVLALHVAIIERLSPSPSALDLTPTWIKGKQAQELTEDFKVPFTLSYISRLARNQPPHFDARFLGGNRLYIRLDSFVKFLWKRRMEQTPSEATEEEADQEIQRIKEEKSMKKLD